MRVSHVNECRFAHAIELTITTNYSTISGEGQLINKPSICVLGVLTTKKNQ